MIKNIMHAALFINLMVFFWQLLALIIMPWLTPDLNALEEYKWFIGKLISLEVKPWAGVHIFTAIFYFVYIAIRGEKEYESI